MVFGVIVIEEKSWRAVGVRDKERWVGDKDVFPIEKAKSIAGEEGEDEATFFDGFFVDELIDSSCNYIVSFLGILDNIGGEFIFVFGFGFYIESGIEIYKSG